MCAGSQQEVGVQSIWVIFMAGSWKHEATGQLSEEYGAIL